MKAVFFLGFSLLLSLSLSGQSALKGKIVSSGGEAVAFCTVIELNSNGNGTTSNEEGFFELSNLKPAYEIQFSSIGYYDTILSVKQFDTSVEVIVRLREKIQFLEEVVVVPSHSNISSFGIPDGAILTYRGKNSGIPNQAGYAAGVYISPGRKDQGIVQSVSIFLTKEGFPEAPFLLRILSSKGKLKDNMLENSRIFEDVLKKIVIVKAPGAGWFDIDLSEYKIKVPSQNFMVMLIPIDYGEKYSWKSANGKQYGGVIGIYEASSVPKMKWAMQRNNTYGYVKAPGRDHVPAIVVNYLKE